MHFGKGKVFVNSNLKFIYSVYKHNCPNYTMSALYHVQFTQITQKYDGEFNFSL